MLLVQKLFYVWLLPLGIFLKIIAALLQMAVLPG